MIQCTFTHGNRLIDTNNLTSVELKQLELSNSISWYEWKGKGKREKKSKQFLLNLKYLPGGFWYRTLKLSEKKYNVQFTNFNAFQRQITPEDLEEWLGTIPFANNYYPYWYQIKSIFLAIKYPISRSSVATGGGKTFIMYLLARYLLEKIITSGKKILIIVPSVMLVDQTADEFLKEFQADDFISVDKVYGGSKRNKTANVVIANIDSAIERDSEFFEDFEAVFYDEAHKLTTEGYRKIFEYLLPNTIHQIYGLSGSFYPDNTVEEWNAEAIAGPILMKVSTHELIEGGQLTPIEIHCCKFHHTSLSTRVAYYTDKTVNSERNGFAGELNFFRNLQYRKEFICTVASSLEFNQLLLFKSVAYCRQYAQYLQEKYPHKKVLVIVGDVDSAERNRIKKFTEENEDVIICATYGTMSTGVSIKNLGGLHFIEAPKSFIWVRQSIGRVLRLHKNKEKAICFDYSDHIKKPTSFEYPEIESKIRKTTSSTHLKDRIKRNRMKVLESLMATRKEKMKVISEVVGGSSSSQKMAELKSKILSLAQEVKMMKAVDAEYIEV
jgi:superfamily II DNA or RNA helicase